MDIFTQNWVFGFCSFGSLHLAFVVRLSIIFLSIVRRAKHCVMALILSLTVGICQVIFVKNLLGLLLVES